MFENYLMIVYPISTSASVNMEIARKCGEESAIKTCHEVWMVLDESKEEEKGLFGLVKGQG